MAARFPNDHDCLYFDTLCRTQKGESVLSLIHATYQVKKNFSSDIKLRISEKLKEAYTLFKIDAGTYSGDPSQFNSQYTIGHELCIWKNAELDLTDLAVKVAENYITIRDYFDIFLLNYIQPVNGKIIHLLFHLLEYMHKSNLTRVSKDNMAEIYMKVSESQDRGEINGAFHILIASNYFKSSSNGKDLIYTGSCHVSELIKKCNITYIAKGYEAAKAELGTPDEYIKYLLHDNRYHIDINKMHVINDTIQGGENKLFYGVPGSGKSYAIKKIVDQAKGTVERVVFHPDYTFSDFIGQIMPTYVNGQIGYRFIPGVFTSILKAANEDTLTMHYLIIEEINRGNASAIFGEVFQLLDRDEKGRSEYGITNFDISKELYGIENRKIFIPSNLTILATMNTSDQNIFTIDTAFQRRWNMCMVDNVIDEDKYSPDYRIKGSSISWGAFASIVNEMVAEENQDILSTEDKRLGAYFIKTSELDAEKFSEKVIKYLWDDAFKMSKEKLFRREFRALDEVVRTYNNAQNDKIAAILNASVYEKMLEITKNYNV
jgi:hypothetical protein